LKEIKEKEIKKRWYENNENLNILVKDLEPASLLKQVYIAKIIIKMCRSEGIFVKENVSSYVRQLRRRWYDKDETVCLSMEHLKITPDDIQTKVAGKILYNLDKINEFLDRVFFSEEESEEKEESTFE